MIMKKHLFYFTAGSTIIIPAVVMICSGDLTLTIVGCMYAAVLNFYVPRKFWRHFWKSNIYLSKYFER